MSSALDPTSTSRPAKPQRVLACVLCQQRKIRCDRTFPCANCTKSRAQCVPATLMPRQRRRRFPERDLLARLRHYEGLLRQHKIDFEPLHPDASKDKASPETHDEYGDDEGQSPAAKTEDSSASNTGQSETVYQAKSFWHAMHAGFRGGDDSEPEEDEMKYKYIHDTWERQHKYDDHLLLGVGSADVDLSPLQPGTLHIFRLWQIYLDNVNPLLKIIHTPSLQSRIVEAASSPAGIDRNLEALMFSIYCIAIVSLSSEECFSIFGETREDMSVKFRFACQQALGKCEFLRTNSRDCVTALYLYLVSVIGITDPRTLSSLLGIVVRVAQRMGYHSETDNATQSPLEGEMRRRVWWALILFDARICEMSNQRSGQLIPTWDCSVPMNVNDTELRSEMKGIPVSQSRPSEAIFAVVRAEVGRYVRRTNFHLDFTNPALKQLAPIDKLTQDFSKTSISEGDSELDDLQKYTESKYLRYCNEEDPVQYLTIWYTRGFIARCRLIEFYSQCAQEVDAHIPPGDSPSSQSRYHPSETQRDAAFNQALVMLDCDTKILAASKCKGYLWLMDHNFPAIAYLHVVGVLRRRPQMNKRAEQAWQIMDENFDVRFEKRAYEDVHFKGFKDNPLVQFFAKVVLGAWTSVEMAHVTSAPIGVDLPSPPKIVTGLRKIMAESRPPAVKGEPSSSDAGSSMGDQSDPTNMFGSFTAGGTPNMDMPMDMPMDFASDTAFAPYAKGWYNFAAPQQGGAPGANVAQQQSSPFDISMYPLDFTSMHGTWNSTGNW